MSLLRTDQQAAMNALHLLVVKSIDHYVDAGEFLQSDDITRFIQATVKQREQFCERIVSALDLLDDLPIRPDVEKESLEQLAFHIEAKSSSDEASAVLQQRLVAEKELLEQIKQTQDLQFEEAIQEMLQELELHVQQQIKQLQIKLSS